MHKRGGELSRSVRCSSVRSGVFVGHVPRKISSVCSMFLRRGGTISCRVTGSRRIGVGSKFEVERPCCAAQSAAAAAKFFIVCTFRLQNKAYSQRCMYNILAKTYSN